MSVKQQYHNMSDDEIQLIAGSDDGALEYLLDKYKNLVRARARSYFLAGADREDIIQEGMIGLYKAIRDYKPGVSSFMAFADLCITRQLLSAVKTASRQKHIPLNSYVSLYKPLYDGTDDNEFIDCIRQNALDPEDIILGREGYKTVENAIYEKLSGLELNVLLLYLKGMSYSEIADAIKKPEKSVDNALQRIKSKLNEFNESR